MSGRAIAPPVIAIDGPAAAGKGTLARRIADAFGVPYLDTGTLYRAVGARLLDDRIAPVASPDTEARAVAASGAIDAADLARIDLRTPDADRMASLVASFPAVRAALLDTQRHFARRQGAVLDGRDIGTVVFPDADAKLFVTADPAERARRRLLQRGETAAPDAIERERAALVARDQADSLRAVAPLRQADDADLLDTTALDPDAAFALACALIRARIARCSDPSADRALF